MHRQSETVAAEIEPLVLPAEVSGGNDVVLPAPAPQRQEESFGEKLIQTAEAWCRENGKGGILLTTHMANIRAQVLYERCGFERLGVHSESNELLYLLRF